jgi:hyperosmotically inducible protein
MCIMRTRTFLPAAAVLLALAVAHAPLRAQKTDPDPQLQAEVQKALSKKQFAAVQVQVADGVVTLTGEVNKLNDKIDAGKKAEHFRPVDVHNRIQVSMNGGPAVSDQELGEKISKKLIYARQGYWTQPFNAFTLGVHDGVVTVGGVAVRPEDKDEVIADITDTPGVRDLVDNIKVAPVSNNDDQLRRALFNAIYGYPTLNRYAIDPAKQIRIVVVNGHATLVGSVDSASDKQIAGMRANGVPGVFSVTNDLQVAGQGTER